MDLWSFKKPGPSILDEQPIPYVSAFLGYTVFASDLGIQTIRVDTVESPDFFQTSKMDSHSPEFMTGRASSSWRACGIFMGGGLVTCANTVVNRLSVRANGLPLAPSDQFAGAWSHPVRSR